MMTTTERYGQPWTAEEDAIIRAEYSVTPLEQIAAKLGRSFNGTASRIYDHLKLRKRSSCLPWSPEEVDYLRANYKTMRINAIAHQLNRSRLSILSKAVLLGLVSDFRRGWAQDDVVITNLTQEGFTADEIVKRLDRRSRTRVRKRQLQLGLVASQSKAGGPYGLPHQIKIHPAGLQVLLFLLDGPRTVLETSRICNIHAGQILRNLLKHNLVSRYRDDGYHSPFFYMLSPYAMDLLANAPKEDANGRP